MDLLISGDVQSVISGLVKLDFLQAVSLTKMKYGLGGGAQVINGQLEIGETLVYEGIGHIYAPQWIKQEKESVQTPFLMGISSKPSQQISIGNQASLEQLYKTLLLDFPSGVVIVGECHFSNLAVAYLKRSPIFGENINTFHNKYWESETFKNHSGKIFGVVLPTSDPRIFYKNPNEAKESGFPSHTHILINEGARHLLTHSSITSGDLWLESIDDFIII